MSTMGKLQAENERLVAERDALAAKLAKIVDAWVAAGFWPDTDEEIVRLSYAITSDPQQCLRDVQAEAGRAGFVAGTACCADYLDTYYADIDFSKHADHYAEKVRNGE